MNRTPGQPGFLELGDQARPSLLLAPERGPGAVLLELLQELHPRQGPLVAGHLGPEGLHEGRGGRGRDAEEPLDVAPREELSVELLELADGVGDREQPPRFRGHRAGPHRQPENEPPDGGVDELPRSTAAGTSIRPAARAGHPRVAASSATSSAGLSNAPAPAAAAAGVPEANSPRSTGFEALGDPGAFPFGADPGGTPAAPPPILVNPLSVLKLVRFSDGIPLMMLVEGFTECKIRVPSFRVP